MARVLDETLLGIEDWLEHAGEPERRYELIEGRVSRPNECWSFRILGAAERRLSRSDRAWLMPRAARAAAEDQSRRARTSAA
jgi:hypothetical protein